jgi:2-dehydro-3-deoxygalactonokinase
MSASPRSDPGLDSTADTPCAGIGLDWGTTNLRAFLLGADGSVLAHRERPWGILSLPAAAADGGFDQALEGIAGDWLARHLEVPLVASGMVGSAQGWREAPYVRCPASAADLATRFTDVHTAGGHRLRIAPGLLHDRADELPDVMRGEETQVVGALDADSGADCCFVLPGTHCKWVLVRDGRIEAFTTAMTGELYAALVQHTILGRLMEPAATNPAAAGDGWRRAIALARDSRPGDLMRHLFTARSMHLAGRLPAGELADYLSGLLIGHEIVSALAWLAERAGPQVPLVLVGEAALAGRYRDGLAAFDLTVPCRGNTAAAGLHRLLTLAGIR